MEGLDSPLSQNMIFEKYLPALSHTLLWIYFYSYLQVQPQMGPYSMVQTT